MLSKTSMHANFLPTDTFLTYEKLLPVASIDGSYSSISITMLRALLVLCIASCLLFHFTDSFHALDNKVYYGFIIPRGLWLFRTGFGVEVPREDRLRVGFINVVHTVMLVLVFAAIWLHRDRTMHAQPTSHHVPLHSLTVVVTLRPHLLLSLCHHLTMLISASLVACACH